MPGDSFKKSRRRPGFFCLETRGTALTMAAIPFCQETTMNSPHDGPSSRAPGKPGENAVSQRLFVRLLGLGAQAIVHGNPQ